MGNDRSLYPPREILRVKTSDFVLAPFLRMTRGYWRADFVVGVPPPLPRPLTQGAGKRKGRLNARNYLMITKFFLARVMAV